MNRSEAKKRTRARRRRFFRRLVRKRRVTWPLHRRGGRRFWRGRGRRSLGRRVFNYFNRPILVRFFHSREVAVSGDEFNDTFTVNLKSFNNDGIRQQLYGYLELFDQFKIVEQELVIHFKTTAEWKDMNTNIPEMFWAYDYDLKRQKMDLFNIVKLQNFHHMLMPPMRKLKLRLRPRWADNRLILTDASGQSISADTQSGIRRVDNPWLDTKILSMNSGQAPDVGSMNGWAVAINVSKCSLYVLQ